MLAPDVAPDDTDTRSADGAALRRFAALLAAGALLGTALGYAFSFTLTPRWQAVGSVRPGQVGVPAPGAAPNGLEPLGTVYERLNSPGFGQELAAGLAASGRPLSGASSIQALVIETAGSVRVRSQAGTREDATRVLDAAIASTIALHDEVYRPATAQLERWRTELTAMLERTSAERERLVRDLSGGNARGVPDDRLIRTLVELRDAEVLSLSDRLARLEAAMSPLVTFPTRSVVPTWAPPDPYHPNRPVIAVMGAMAGAALAALAVLLLRPAR
ncbi:MAG: hypothetical protein ACK5PW_22125 [Burkholderiales bacterium]|jgi:hypothetical protein